MAAAALAMGALVICPHGATAAENPAYTEALERLNSISSAYDDLTVQQDATFTQLEEVRAQIADNETQAAEVQSDIEAGTAQLADQQAALASQIAVEYKMGGVNPLLILLSSSSFEEAVSKLHYHIAVCQHEAEAIATIKDTKVILEGKRDELEGINQELLKQQACIEELYDEQSQQADAMYQQQLEAATLVQSLPKEVQDKLGDDVEELVNESKAVINAQDTSDQDAVTPAEASQPSKDKQEEPRKEEAEPAESESKKDEDAADKQEAADKDDTSTEDDDSHAKDAQEPPQKDDETSDAPTADDDSTQEPADADGTSTATEEEEPQEPEVPAEEPASDGTMQAVVDMAYATGATRADWGCSGWVYTVFKNAGISNFSGTAARFYNTWCYSSDRSQLMPGMVIAVSNTGGSAAGRMYGHVGIYVGNNTVRHFTRGEVFDMSLDSWISTYGKVCTVRWGWNGGVALS